MKILFYSYRNKEKYDIPTMPCDYMVDCLYHGFKSLLGDNCVEQELYDHMYNDYPNPLELYGRGFTIFAKMNRPPHQTWWKNFTNYNYDKIIIPIHHTRHKDPKLLDFLWAVNFYYHKKDIAIIDGNDDCFLSNEIKQYGTVFKRELLDNSALPIHFSIPENIIVESPPQKSKDWAISKPTFEPASKYEFVNEQDYYKDYQNSRFGLTKKKGGWDCLRHYEILANGCIPYFENLQNCPPNIMHRFPKELTLQAMNEGYSNIIVEDLLEHTKKYLTTTSVAKYVLEKIS